MKSLMAIYDTLYTHYGNLNWWPAKSPYEVIVGAVLVQNTAWGNVEKAITNFADNLNPETITKIDIDNLKDIIKPAGFFNQKALYLKAITEWFAGYSFDTAIVVKEPMDKIRSELLSTKGIGKETADAILLYAFGFPSFVIDAYTIRLCSRIPIDIGNGYDIAKAYFENNIPKSIEIYNNFHALIVINAQQHCRKKPLCQGCPLVNICDFNEASL